MNILLTSVGRRTYLINYFKDALDGIGLVYAANSIMTYSLTQADKYTITPAIYDEGYIDYLLDYCDKHSITAIISLFDIDLPILAANKHRFTDIGVEVIVSDLEVIDTCNDKWKTYQFLKNIGLNQPQTYLNIDSVKREISEGNLTFPVIIKPRWGMGSIGVFEAEDIEELDIYYKKLSRYIFETYLKYESQADVSSCIIIQEKIQGVEYGLDIFNDFNSRNVAVIPKEKVAMRAGETDIARITYRADLIDIGIKLAETLKHQCNLDVDCFIAEDNEIYVLEMNCRFGGQYPFSHVAGANFPRQIVRWLLGESTDINLVSAKDGVTACKELLPVIIDSISS
ncbi:MAG: ATP-grasp domain-containing protein [Rikenellaceae bacterium]